MKVDLTTFRKGDIVAIETKEAFNDSYWFAGEITAYYPPNSKWNDKDTWSDTDLHVDISQASIPQWSSDSDLTKAYYSDINDMILLFRIPNFKDLEKAVGEAIETDTTT